MRPADIQIIGEELAIKWSDGQETYIPLRVLRERCPCAGCQGETDVMGQVHRGPPRALTPQSFHLTRIESVGGYAVQPYWADGHSTGLYAFEYLKRLGESGGG